MKAAVLVKAYTVAGVAVQVFHANNSGDGLDWHQHDFAHTCDARIGRVVCETEEGKAVEIGPHDPAICFRPFIAHRIVALDDGCEFQNVFRTS